ncbi:hypothetical protein EJV47_22465 [Hymenobacter gummosus]|uniref:Uncharacterized protein n=1 Tax=Hymenobacter gummosus TaxID=1776032 RepID=A0A3S0K256_9BACT|nr:hypothetical protein [Hymenobacter gummosus]RTQ46292.1 hypothetical protein EJV47_22465 [Hymenobacter gummosus]
MYPLLRFRNLLFLLLSGLIIIGLGAFFKVSRLHPVWADGSLLVGMVCVLLAKVLLLVQSVRWALRVNRRLAEA